MQLKTVFPIAFAAFVGFVIFGIGFGILAFIGGVVFYGEGYAAVQSGFSAGTIVGFVIGAVIGFLNECRVLMVVNKAIPSALGFGAITGAAIPAFYFWNLWFAIPGAWVGITLGLSIWRAWTSNSFAKQYSEKRRW